MDRRSVLKQIAAVGCSAAASPLVTPVVLAATPGSARLVVIVLRGGLDGLDAVAPFGDPSFAGLRRGLADGAHDLGDGFAMHPALAGLAPLWKSGELAFAHAVSTPYRNKRSHFDGQDVLETGGGGTDGGLTTERDGWLNRLLPALGGGHMELAFAVGRERLRLLSGDAPHARWSPDADLDLSPQGRHLLERIYADDPLFLTAARQAGEFSELAADRPSVRNAGRAEALAGFAADRLNEETRIAAFSITGFDTHRQQDVALPRALSQLEAAILTLRTRLGANWQQTAVIAMTEFGRTARINGTGGTDHGTGGLAVMAGGALAGARIHGRWPGLGEADLFERRDLMPTDDVRRYAAWMLRGLFGVDRHAIETRIFPGLDLGDAPGLMA